MKRTALTILVCLALVKVLAADSPEVSYNSLPCWNPDLPLEQRVADMVARLDT